MACMCYLEGPSTQPSLPAPPVQGGGGGQAGNLSLTALAHIAIHTGPH